MARLTSRRLFLAILLLVPALSIGSAGIRASGESAPPILAQDSVWQFVAQRPAGAGFRGDLTLQPVVARFSKNAFDIVTTLAARDGQGTFVVTLPMPDGTLARFRASHSPVVSPAVAAEVPEIETYRAQGIDDPTATARFGWTHLGFHAIVLSETGTSYVDPYQDGDNEYHAVFSKQDHWHQGDPMRCLVGMGMEANESATPARFNNEFPISHGTSLRTYRLALASTAEYTAAAGGVDNARARMIATINRVNGVYERDISVRLELVTGISLIFDNASTDPYTNNVGSTMLDQNQTTLDSMVGSAAYDIGHVFSTGGGGVAQLRSVCSPTGKARGVTGLSNPTGDVFDIDYVAHEIGHQFGANHTFNGGSGSCSGNRSASHAYEVGSGSTILSYSGICAGQNLQANSDDYFHVESLNEMTAFVTTGGGANCGSNVALGNVPPTVSTPASFTVPRTTPFVLTASASDANGDALTYTWEQFDLGQETLTTQMAGTDLAAGPLFRSRAPSSRPIREFPSMQYVLQASAVPIRITCPVTSCISGEAFPFYERTMQFQVTVRDNRAGNGGIATARTSVTVAPSAGPFLVTSPNSAISVQGGSTRTVTWDPSGTHLSPVNTSQVEISLSTDGGATFSTVLVSATPNNGSANVVIPNTPTSAARIRIGAVGNIFFDVSDTNFTITAGTTPTPTVTPTPTATPTPTPTPSSCVGNPPVSGWVCVNGGWVPPDHPSAGPTPTPTPTPTPSPTPTPTPGPTPTPSPVACVGNPPVSGWVCVNGGWLPPNHPLATPTPTPTPTPTSTPTPTPTATPTPTPTPTSTPTPTPSTCSGNPPVSGWVCVNGGWVPSNHPLAVGVPTPTPTPSPTPTPTPTPGTCVGNPPVSGWVCVNGGWVPPNHPLAGKGGPP